MTRNPRYALFQKALIDARQEKSLTQQEVALRLWASPNHLFLNTKAASADWMLLSFGMFAKRLISSQDQS
jgi:hypothetical protein